MTFHHSLQLYSHQLDKLLHIMLLCEMLTYFCDVMNSIGRLAVGDYMTSSVLRKVALEVGGKARQVIVHRTI